MKAPRSTASRQKYRRLYRALIEHARMNPPREGVVTEEHHVRPRCMGGSDAPANIVSLTVRQHLLAHDLLARAYGHRWKGLWMAAKLMHNLRGERVPGVVAARARREADVLRSESQRGRVFSDETRAKMSSAARKRCENPSERKRLSELTLGKRFSGEVRAKVGEATRRRMANPLARERIARGLRKPICIRSLSEGRAIFGDRKHLAALAGISAESIKRLVSGEYASVKGWSLVDLAAAKGTSA